MWLFILPLVGTVMVYTIADRVTMWAYHVHVQQQAFGCMFRSEGVWEVWNDLFSPPPPPHNSTTTTASLNSSSTHMCTHGTPIWSPNQLVYTITMPTVVASSCMCMWGLAIGGTLLLPINNVNKTSPPYYLEICMLGVSCYTAVSTP